MAGYRGAINGKDGGVTHYVGTKTDITERKTSENIIKSLDIARSPLPRPLLLLPTLLPGPGRSLLSRGTTRIPVLEERPVEWTVLKERVIEWIALHKGAIEIWSGKIDPHVQRIQQRLSFVTG